MDERVDELVITKNYIKELEQQLAECNSSIERQKRINIRLMNNYEYLDQLYDKVLLLLTEEQKTELNKLLTGESD
tara:strand:- start:866 stop:1090 length:225 start_codon:yes stop_codon:yes gene_type:complete